MKLARVLSEASDGRIILWHHGSTLDIEVARCRQTLEPGDMVDLDGEDGQVVLILRPTAADGFSKPAANFRRFSENDGRRYRALHERARILAALRGSLDGRGFVEIEPPSIARSPGLEVHLEAIAVSLRDGFDGPSVQRFLVTSPEYHMKRLLVAGFERIYSMAKVYRSGERGAWHNPEFTMLEWYRAGARYPQLARDVEDLVKSSWQAVCETFDPQRLATMQPLIGALSQPFETLAFRELMARHCDDPPDDADAGGLIAAFVEFVEPNLPRDRGVVIDRWPASLASLARRFDDEDDTAERFEVFLCGVELANGFSELVDPVEQAARFEQDLAQRRALGLSEYPVDQAFLDGLAEGCPPAAGVALGVDRLVMLLGGYRSIDDVIAFPFEKV